MSDHTYNMTMSESMLHEFYELNKQAGRVPAWVGNVALGTLGAVGGGLLGRRNLPEEERTGGMIRGALLGGLTGALGGQFATEAGREAAHQFGQRQLHGLTGYLPGRGLLGRAEKAKWYQLGEKAGQPVGKERLKLLNQMGFDIPTSSKDKILEKSRKEVAEGTISGLMPKKVQEFWAKRHASAKAAQKGLAEEGMTSLPGLVKGFGGGLSGKLTPYEAAKLNIKSPGLLLGAAIPAAMTAQSLNEYRQTGDVRGLGQQIGTNLGFMAGGLPIVPAFALGTAAGEAGKLIGRGVEKIEGQG